MLQSAKTIRNISLHEPGRTRPGPLDLHESGVATPSRPKAVGSVAEPGLVVRLKALRRMTSWSSLSEKVGSPSGRFLFDPFFSM
jgi:hypothetical protein